MAESELVAFVGGLGPEWRGLSLTRPLKEVAFEVATTVTDVARDTGSINTLLRRPDGGWDADNTDVIGVLGALADVGVHRAERPVVVGSGATARSVVAAFVALGARRVDFMVRGEVRPATWPRRRRPVCAVTRRDVGDWPDGVDVVVSTAPGRPVRGRGQPAAGSGRGPRRRLRDAERLRRGGTRAGVCGRARGVDAAAPGGRAVPAHDRPTRTPGGDARGRRPGARVTFAPAVSAPWWLVAVVTVAGAGLGWWLARELGTGGYRLDDEADRRRPGPPLLLAVAVPVLWGVLAWRLGGLSQGAALPAYLLLAWAGVALFWIDLDTHRLPEGLTLPVIPGLLVLLAVASATTGDWGALLRAVICGVAGWLVYAVLAFVVPGGLGLGDATLGGLVALPLGYLAWGVPILGFVAAYLVSGVVALVGLATRRLTLRSHIAFGPFIVIGALVALLVRFQLV